jgi:peptide deformylase
VVKAPSYERSKRRGPNLASPPDALSWLPYRCLQGASDHRLGHRTELALIADDAAARCFETMSTTTTASTPIGTMPILIAPSPFLKARASPVKPADADLVRELIPRMFAAMYQAPGIGLAAPQVSQSLRLIVIDLMPEDKKQPFSLINPEIVAVSDEFATREEGCLSLPGQYADITRPARVKVRYLDETGAKCEVEGDGLLAACLQHEIDHLNGVLFVDHLSALKRNMIMRRLAKEQRQKRDEQQR